MGATIINIYWSIVLQIFMEQITELAPYMRYNTVIQRGYRTTTAQQHRTVTEPWKQRENSDKTKHIARALVMRFRHVLVEERIELTGVLTRALNNKMKIGRRKSGKNEK